MDNLTKRERCKNAFPNIKNDEIFWECNAQDGASVSEKECENCDCFCSKFIEYPVTINGIKNHEIVYDEKPSLCMVRPCAEEYKNKTFLGLYLGCLPITIQTTLDKTGTLSNFTSKNPAIYVFELNKIVWGYESFWQRINSVDDFKNITDEDIDNVWYVKLLKGMDNNA